MSLQLTMLSTAIAVIGCGIGAYTDYKTGYVPDKLNYSLLALGAILVFLRMSFESALQVYGVAFVIFLIGFIAYLFGQFGGGDVKFFAAVYLLIPRYPEFLSNFSPVTPFTPPYPFVLSLFFSAAVIAVFFVSFSYFKKLYRDRKQIPDLKEKVFHGLINSFFVVPLLVLWVYLKKEMLLIGIPLVMGSFLLAFKEEIMSRYVVITKKVSELNDDDVLALELMTEKQKKQLGISNRRTFLDMELKKLKEKALEEGVTEVPVNEYLPRFMPFVFASMVLNLVFGDAFLWLLFN
jgi:Flp pilus assembly protein protease CpaA